MKILWVKTDFLHPPTKGGHIRTLQMLRQLHKRHEIHYAAFEDPHNPEGSQHAPEYSTRAYPIPHRVIPKLSPRFAGQVAAGLVSPMPVACARYRSATMRDQIARLVREQDFDAKVCDFIFPAINIPDLSGWVLFQHNVETIIWERHAQSGRTSAHRAYFARQAKRMLAWERSVCRSAAHVVAVSQTDEQIMRSRFGIRDTSWVATGVDLAYFKRPPAPVQEHDLVFVGSMDWMPNVDGIRWFLAEVLPLIRAQKPDCRLAIVGREPPASLAAEAKDGLVSITGTVPDVRPYLWNAAVSIVPLRVGGGTRLKIFEAMAAGTAVVSTTIGAEGLPVRHGETIRIADSAEAFAAECLHLLDRPDARAGMAGQALQLIHANFSWDQAVRGFEETLCSVQTAATQTA